MALGHDIAGAALARWWVKRRPFSLQSLGFSQGHCMWVAVALGQGLPEGTPGMEAAGEGMLLVTLSDQA